MSWSCDFQLDMKKKLKTRAINLKILYTLQLLEQYVTRNLLGKSMFLICHLQVAQNRFNNFIFLSFEMPAQSQHSQCSCYNKGTWAHITNVPVLDIQMLYMDVPGGAQLASRSPICSECTPKCSSGWFFTRNPSYNGFSAHAWPDQFHFW
jgi:hypothetical protein